VVLVGDYRGRDGLLAPLARAELSRHSLPGAEMTVSATQASPKVRPETKLRFVIVGQGLAPEPGVISMHRGSAV
jgi:hypothetical protein